MTDMRIRNIAQTGVPPRDPRDGAYPAYEPEATASEFLVDLAGAGSPCPPARGACRSRLGESGTGWFWGNPKKIPVPLSALAGASGL